MTLWLPPLPHLCFWEQEGFPPEMQFFAGERERERRLAKLLPPLTLPALPCQLPALGQTQTFREPSAHTRLQEQATGLSAALSAPGLSPRSALQFPHPANPLEPPPPGGCPAHLLHT